MLLKILLAAAFVIIITIEDICEYKIKNRTIMIFLILGLIINALTGNKNEIISGIIGMIIPLILFPLFVTNMLGAGDIKAFCVLGIIFGWRAVIEIILLSFLSGGIIAVGFTVFRKGAIDRFKHLFIYLRTIFLTKKLTPYRVNGAKDESTFRFSFGIAGGLIVYMLSVLLNITILF